MLDVRPFRGLCYNPVKIAQMGDVVTPPYDVISPEQRAEYLRRSPYNVARLILPDGEDPYANARNTLSAWISQEILIQDQEPGIYCYHQTFQTPEGEEKTRKGFLALVRLEEFDRGVVLPHESTLSSPKEDRLKLLRACKTNFSPIFGLYSDPEQKLESLLEPLTEAPPRAKVVDDAGITNLLWRITDPAALEAVQAGMKDRWVLIADGHHRYESCLIYRNEMAAENPDPEAPFQFTLMFLTNIDHPGIEVLPYNRGILNLPKFEPPSVLKKAGKYFDIREFEDRDPAENALRKEGKNTIAFVAQLRDSKSFYLFKLKPHAKLEDFYPPETPEAVRRLDVNVLHKVFIEQILGISDADVREQKYIKYYKDAREERRDFEAGRLQIAFFLNPTRVDQVVEVSRAGARMPQKSTFFYPKLMTGFVMNKH